MTSHGIPNDQGDQRCQAVGGNAEGKVPTAALACASESPGSNPAAGAVRLPRRALSVRQPWAWLIVNGWKNIENRMWRTSYRGPVLIHAAKGMTRDEYNGCRVFMAGFTDLELPPIAALERGGIVGVATVLDCVDEHSSEWFCGEWGFVLADARPLQFLPCKGQLGFFPADYYWDEARIPK